MMTGVLRMQAEDVVAVTQSSQPLVDPLPARASTAEGSPPDRPPESPPGIPAASFPGADERQAARHRSRVWVLLAAIALTADAFVVGAMVDRGGTYDSQAATGIDPIACLGRTFDAIACTTMPAAWGDSRLAACGTWGATVSPESTVTTVSMYAAGRDGFAGFTGPLPLGLHWGELFREISARVGSPALVTSAFGTPTMVYMFADAAYGSLELQFDSRDRLIRVSANLTR